MMQKDAVKKEIEVLRDKIRRHDYNYYCLAQPEVSDKEYDDLLSRLKLLEDSHPEFKSSDSPTLRVGGGVLEGFSTVRHQEKMLSLDNTYDFNELKDWDERARKGLSQGEISYVAELKIDGVSANIVYQNGKLVVGATRGDGETGEDVTQNIKTIRAIPLMLLGQKIPEFIEVRGEIFMEKDEFKALNKERKVNAEALFANPRNAAAGSLKLLDSGLVAKRRLNFLAHSLGAYKGLSVLGHWEYLEKLKNWGVPVNANSKIFHNLDEVIDYCKEWQKKRDGLKYEIDGVVIKIDGIGQQKRLGFTAKSPRWAVAYKFPARQATTEILKINFQVGRTGIITPVAELYPVECSGVVIQHATLHNFDEIKRLGVREGDRVLIERAGDVIPKVVKVVVSKGGRMPANPSRCPVCQGEVAKEKEEEVALRCVNPLCPAQLERGLMHFASRSAMDIEGMGEAVVEQLVRNGMVRDFADIYFLKKEDLLKLELFKDKKADNLLKGIKESKNRPLSRLLYGLGIRHVGEKVAYVLAKHFRSLDNLLKADISDFDAIYEVGPVMSGALIDFFSQDRAKELIQKIKIAQLNLKEELAEPRKSGLTDKAVVFTGELKSFTRMQAEKIARDFGAKPSSQVSSKTGFVIIGENPGSKYDKAQQLGIKIITEEEFQEMIR